jgi:hypothetical protein
LGIEVRLVSDRSQQHSNKINAQAGFTITSPGLPSQELGLGYPTGLSCAVWLKHSKFGRLPILKSHACVAMLSKPAQFFFLRAMYHFELSFWREMREVVDGTYAFQSSLTVFSLVGFPHSRLTKMDRTSHIM